MWDEVGVIDCFQSIPNSTVSIAKVKTFANFDAMRSHLKPGPITFPLTCRVPNAPYFVDGGSVQCPSELLEKDGKAPDAG